MAGVRAEAAPDERYKVVILGGHGVGKSSLLRRVTTHTFRENYEPTLGAAHGTLRVELDTEDFSDKRHVEMSIWDTSMAAKYRSVAPACMRNCSAALLVFDLTRQESTTILSDLKAIFFRLSLPRSR